MAAPNRSTLATYARLAVISATHVFNDGALLARAAVLPMIRNEFMLSNAEVGLINSFSTASSAIFQLPASFVADYTGRKKTVLAGGLMLVALTFLAWSWSPTYAALLGVSFVFGIAGAGYHPSSVAIVTQQFDSQRRAFFLAIHNLGANLGSALMPALMGLFALWVGWRQGSLYIAVPIALVAVLTYFTFKEQPVRSAGIGRSLTGLKSDVLLNRRLLLLATVSTLNAGAYQGLMPFLPLYLADTFEWDAGKVGAALGVLHFTGIFSQPVVGYLADRYGRQKLMILLLFLTGITTLSLPLVRDANALFVALGVLGLPLFCFRPLLFAAATEVVGPASTSSAIGLIFTLNQIFATLSPILGGLVADRLGLSTTIFFYAGIYLLACVPAIIVLRPTSGGPLPQAEAT